MISLDLLEQVCSRLCHDLAGPVGAIRNGIELLAEANEPDGAEGDQALELIGHSADQAAQRLRVFRLAYGRATRDGLRGFSDLREAAQDWLAAGRVVLRWAPGQLDDGLAARPGLGRLVLNLVMLGTEVVPQGGTVTVVGSGTAASGAIMVAVTGRIIRWPPELVDALGGRMTDDEIGPRTIQGVITSRFARHYGFALNWAAADAETRTLHLTW